MVVDLLPVLKNEGAVLPIEGSCDLDHLRLSDAGPVFDQPVQVKAQLENVGGALELTGTVSGQFMVLCARCTKELTEPFCFEFFETLSNDADADAEEDGVIAFTGTTLDLTDIVVGNILVNLSLRYLCSDDCKGLCPVCGADRNVTDCHCDTQEVDPRLSVLKKFYDGQE